jgi:hypothetical protein
MNRLAQAREILTRATQEPSACPFLAAVPPETRAALETKFPHPHELPENQLQEIAAQHGFSTPQSPKTPVGAGLASPLPETLFVIPQPKNELEMPVIDNVFLSALTGWVQATQARIAREVLSYEQEARQVLLSGYLASQDNPPLQKQRQDPPLEERL